MTTTEKKAKPILFSGPMVRAILDGKKTQTRRVVDGCVERGGAYSEEAWCRGDMPKASYSAGELVYVREAWRPYAWHEGRPFVIEYADGTHREMQTEYHDDDWLADWEERQLIRISKEMKKAGIEPDADGLYESNAALPWRPSIHFLRGMARITLEVTGVRVERVQEISPADCVAEGLPYVHPAHRDHFIELWDSINAGRGFGWDANPWVWVYEFTVAEVRK